MTTLPKFKSEESGACNDNVPDPFWERLDRSGACWLWTGPVGRNGYGTTSHGPSKWDAHRLAWHLANSRVHDRLPRSIYIRHKCDVKLCCNPDHLETGTANDNAQDTVRRGRTNGGKPAGCSHRDLKPAIYELADAGLTKKQIAGRLGMTERNVYYHLSKRTS